MAIATPVRPLTSEAQVTRRPQRSALIVLKQVGVYLVITVLALCCVIPFAWVLLTSVDANAGLYLQLPTLTLDNFVKFFTEEGTPRLLANSIWIATASTALTLGFGIFGILLIRVVPPTATIVPLYMIMINLGLNDTYTGLILVEAAYQLPLALWLLKGFIDSIPMELEEAAWIDGCSRLRGAWRVVFPLARPGIGACALFSFINVWGDFLTPLVLLQSPEKYPISIGMFRAFSGRNQVDWGLLTATAVLYMVPTVLLYLFVRRYLLRATVSGALKG